jgi:hypothetical protein
MSVERVLPAVLGALATTDQELVRHPRRLGRERAVVAYTLRRFAGASTAAIGSVLRVSAGRASDLARAGESHWNSDERFAATVGRAVGDRRP